MKDMGWGTIILLMLAGLVRPVLAQQVRVDLLADQIAAVPGRSFRVGVHLSIEPGWHIYWLNPGDAGLPTQVKLRVPDGWTVGEVRFPVPDTFVQPGDLVGYGYADQVLLTAQVAPPADLDVDSITLQADVSWLVCKDVCIPGRRTLSLTLPVAGTAQVANEQLFAAWQPRYPASAGKLGATVRQSLVRQRDHWDGQIQVTWERPPAEARLLGIPGDALEISDIRVDTQGSLTTAHYRLRVLGGQKTTDATLPLVLAYRSASDAPWRGVALEQTLEE